MKSMKKTILLILSVALLVGALTAVGLAALASDLPFENLYKEGFGGYTSDEGQILTGDFVSSKPIEVTEGKTLWFGPCERTQYFHLVGLDSQGKAATDKIRGKDLEVTETFTKGSVIYRYTVPAGVSSLVFSAPKELSEVYTVTEAELTELTWRAYWSQMGKDTDSFVGQSSYYEVSEGDKLYFGAITEADAKAGKLYGKNGQLVGNMDSVTLVESFGGAYGLYCYTVPAGVSHAQVAYDPEYEQYYFFQKNAESAEAFTKAWIEHIGIQLPLTGTVEKLSGKTALFLGDSITYGARDYANIYSAGGWAGRIGYYAEMDITNNGVSGACITTGRLESHSEKHYILNNLLATKGTEYDYVIMHGLFNDASLPATVGQPQGKAKFDPDKADQSEFADALELLFYQARLQNPNAILGFIVNFKTDRAVDQLPYVNMAIQICEDWGIQYLDLYNLEGFKVTFNDGLHPDSAGYDSMYTVVANWMATLEKGTAVAQKPTQVMSYNVYYGADVSEDKGISIENRYRKVAQKIAQEAPDIAMLQEYTEDFAAVAESILSGTYTGYGVVHPGTGEAAPIIWKTDKYTLVTSGNFTADGDWCVGSKKYPRTVNYVVLEEKTSANRLLVLSVHGQPDMDGASNEEARNKLMALVVEKVAQLRSANGNIPAVIGGDFNISASSAAYAILTEGGLKDIRASVNPAASGSYNAWDRTDPGKFAMGDYLFMTGDVNAITYQVLTDDLDTGRTDGKTVHISDHCPIVSKLLFG